MANWAKITVEESEKEKNLQIKGHVPRDTQFLRDIRESEVGKKKERKTKIRMFSLVNEEYGMWDF